VGGGGGVVPSRGVCERRAAPRPPHMSGGGECGLPTFEKGGMSRMGMLGYEPRLMTQTCLNNS